MYELCTDRAKTLKLQLAERVASRGPPTSGDDGNVGGGFAVARQGWEKTNADFKL